jgi:hypothetical protein
VVNLVEIAKVLGRPESSLGRNQAVFVMGLFAASFQKSVVAGSVSCLCGVQFTVNFRTIFSAPSIIKTTTVRSADKISIHTDTHYIPRRTLKILLVIHRAIDDYYVNDYLLESVVSGLVEITPWHALEDAS